MHRHFGMQINSSEPVYLSACLFRSCCLLLPPPITSAIIFFLRNALATCIVTSMIVMQAIALHVYSYVTHDASETLRGVMQPLKKDCPSLEQWFCTAACILCSTINISFMEMLQAMHSLHGSGHIPYSDAQQLSDC